MPVALPSNLNEAIIEMEKSELVRETFGEHVFEYVFRNKRAEWLDYSRQVSAFETRSLLASPLIHALPLTHEQAQPPP